MKTISKSLYFISCFSESIIIKYPEENVNDKLLKHVSDIYKENAKQLVYGNKRKLDMEQNSFYFGQTHPLFISILCVDKGYPDNIIHNIFNELEALEDLKQKETIQQPFYLNCLSKIYSNYKTVLVEEPEDIENLEITDSQMIDEESSKNKAFIFRKNRSELKKINSWRKMKLYIVSICILLCIVLVVTMLFFVPAIIQKK